MISELFFDIRKKTNINNNLTGEGKKNLLVVFKKEMFSEYEKSKLKSTLDFLKYNFDEDIYLFLCENDPMHVSSLHVKFQKLLVFGMSPEQLGLNIQYPKHQPVVFENFIAIFTDIFSDLDKSPDTKKILWVNIQKLLKNE
ncbi:MAG: hypothetical protein IPM42_19460 [Saprospiraceae bacterium]|nr:hypothetical protein [Saprospiraceae bacterium]